MKALSTLLIFLMAFSSAVFAGETKKQVQTDTGYSYSIVTDLSFEEALEKIPGELEKEGFGIVSRLDVTETMKKKLNKDMKPYMILGACNADFAYKALQAEEQIGLMLPCNVIVYENDAGKTVISAVDPAAAMKAVDNEELSKIAEEVGSRLKKVIERL